MDYLCPNCGPIDEDTGIDVYDCATNFICKKCGANECNMTPLVDAYQKLQAQRDEIIMTNRATRTVSDKRQVTQLVNWVDACACQGIDKGLTVAVDVYEWEEKRTTDQNRKLWPMLTDISKQLEWYGERLAPEDWKDLLSHEWKAQRIVPGVSGGYVALGVRTSKMRKREFAELIEILYAFGSEKGIQWSEPALRVYQEYAEMQK